MAGQPAQATEEAEQPAEVAKSLIEGEAEEAGEDVSPAVEEATSEQAAMEQKETVSLVCVSGPVHTAAREVQHFYIGDLDGIPDELASSVWDDMPAEPGSGGVRPRPPAATPRRRRRP